MPEANQFSEYYKTISNTELLAILENPGQYQPLAVEAAKKEFSERQLSESEINEAKKALIEKQLQRQKQQEKIIAIERKVKSTGFTIIDTLNPIQQNIPATEKIIRFIVLVFGGLFLYNFLKDFKLILWLIKDIPGASLINTLYLLPFLLLPVAVIMFSKRKAIGWILLVIFMIFSAIDALWLLVHSFLWKPSGIPLLDNVSSRPSPATSVIKLIFYTGTLYVICKQNIRQAFAVNDQQMFVTLIISGSLFIFLIYANS